MITNIKVNRSLFGMCQFSSLFFFFVRLIFKNILDPVIQSRETSVGNLQIWVRVNEIICVQLWSDKVDFEIYLLSLLLL